MKSKPFLILPAIACAICLAAGREIDNDAAAVYGRLVRASGIKISLHGDGLDLKRPDLLAEQMALPVNSSMRNATVRTPTDADLIMLAERVYALVDA